MSRRPGDRRRVWAQSHDTLGVISLLFGLFLLLGSDGWGKALAIVPLSLAYLDFRDAGRGPPMSDQRPPWADRHEAIDRKHGFAPASEKGGRDGEG